MKNIFTLLLSFLVFLQGFAQEDLTIKLTELYIPNAPGFVLADKSPSAVEKPVTPRAFALNLLNLKDGGAIDATPFWWSNKGNYTFEKWMGNKIPLLETFNFSVATFKTDSSSVVSGGLRTHLLRIYSKASQEALKAQKIVIQDLLVPTDQQGNPLPIDEKKVNKELKELDRIRGRGLFSIEIAGAVLANSNTNTFKNLETAKSGIWANLRWSTLKTPLDVLAVARYSWAEGNSKTGRDTAFLDFGASLNFEKPRFNISFEYVNRRDISSQENLDRVTFVGNYVVTENIILVASLGKNFDKVDNLITVMGVKFGLSRQSQ